MMALLTDDQKHKLISIAPWVLIPLGLFFVIDYARFLLTLFEVCLALFIIVHMGCLSLGAILAVFKPDYSEYILKLRLTKYLPSLAWSHDLVAWLLEEDDDGS